jgi:pimeloyl-ACP methyl ester carboxylesterase
MEKHPVLPEDDRLFIEYFIGPQLKHEQYVQVKIGSCLHKIAYCNLNKGRCQGETALIMVTGFLSGWTGGVRLDYHLAKQGFNVFSPSLPGYGNSSNYCPGIMKDMLSCEDFYFEAEALAQWTRKVLPNVRADFVGHSEGATTIMALAHSHPELVRSLTLLNPAGFEKRNPLKLGLKFCLNGEAHREAFKGDPLWAELKKFLPKQESALTAGRFRQRLSEWQRLCNDSAFRQLKELPLVPFQYLTGEKDSIFPWSQSAIVEEWSISKKGRRCSFGLLPGLYHNTTMFGSEITAEAISNFIKSLK